ncbi:MAG: hypothetical protein KAT05_13290 [Spirochaetes bacterium]|nr:hypothetical protein [Spirochaetota bacterium]
MNGNKSLDTQLETAFNNSIVSKTTTKELIKKVKLSDNLILYFSQLSIFPTHKRLLFLHRSDLFGFEYEIKNLYLHLCNIPKKNKIKTNEADSATLQHIVSNEFEGVNKYENIISSMLGIDENKQNAIFQDIGDIIAYYGIQFIRNNPNLKKLVNDEHFDYRIMKNVLKNYNETIDLKILCGENDVESENETIKIDPLIISKKDKITELFISSLGKNIENIIEQTPAMVPNLFMPTHLYSNILLKDLLYKLNTTFEEYVSILDALYRNHLIDNKSTMFWCENCSIETPSYTQHHGRIAPSKIPRDKCLICGKSRSYGSLFSLNSTLKEAILSKDGILPVYFGWLLEKEGIEYEVGTYSGKYENDFIINNSILVECKMFKSVKDTAAISSEIDSALSQIKKHITELNSKENQIEEVYLLWNRGSDEKELQNKLKTKYTELFENYGFDIICPEDIEEFVESMN